MRIFRNKKVLTAIFALILACLAYFAWPNHKTAEPQVNSTPATAPNASTTFNKNQYSLTDPNSIWVIVNKKHSLRPVTYAPSDLVVPSVPLRAPGNESMQLRQITASALEQMFAAAKAAGINLQLSSGYRSYSYQVGTYNSYVKQSGQAYANTISARPGFSEHQTGLAADIEPVSRQCEIVDCFANLPEGKWLAANAYKYGFLMRYPADKASITGYDYEPWHFRYIGTALSTELRALHVETLEEFFGVSGGSYSP
ncbi:MAG TPA: M15 family metallopeptidase [Candidatus Saccharimonadales bacterium]|nr:M15 family metallopeptidase [Candidatus Saccharimonadales bacterium]